MAESNIQNMFLSALGSVSTATAMGKHFNNQKQIIEEIQAPKTDEQLIQEHGEKVMSKLDPETKQEMADVSERLRGIDPKKLAELDAFAKYGDAADTKRNTAEALSVRERMLRELSNRRPNWEEEVEAVKPKNQIKRGDK